MRVAGWSLDCAHLVIEYGRLVVMDFARKKGYAESVVEWEEVRQGNPTFVGGMLAMASER